MKRNIINIIDMEYFMYSSMFRQFYVYNIVEKSSRMYLSGTLELLKFICKLLIFMRHTVANKQSSICTLLTAFACNI